MSHVITSADPHRTDVQNDDTPEVAITARLKDIQASLAKINVSPARAKLYNEDIEGLKSHYRPTVMVAICGATGAGKSSLLNALLDAEIVPTSSVRACTAVVTQVSWNKDNDQINANIAFLTRAEWSEELKVLLSDLADPVNEAVKHASQLHGLSATAWAKIHVVYPSVSLQALVDMDVDSLLQKFPHVSQLLGTSARIEATDATQFRRDLEPYLDSREHADHQALWPLICHVEIFCRSEALSSGLTLVDLPGKGDANAARDKMAKDFLKDCDHCWVVSPVTRAISDKVASDLLGHAFRLQLQLDQKMSSNGITFIATKNENVKPAEVINNLDLENNVDFQGLMEDVAVLKQQLSDWDLAVEAVNADIDAIRKRKAEARTKLAGLKNDLDANRANDGSAMQTNENHSLHGKRKYFPMFSSLQERNEASGRKRQRANNLEVQDAGTATGTLRGTSPNNVVNNEAPTPAVPVEELESAIRSLENSIRGFNDELYEVSDCQQSISTERDNASKDLQDAEKEIQAFCATQRAEYSRRQLKEDFRNNLAEYAVNANDRLELPVFVVSSWDYMSLRANARTACFSAVEQTEIPALQEWCHALTRPARDAKVRILVTQFRAFALALKTFLEGAEGVTEEDRKELQRRWAPSPREPCGAFPGVKCILRKSFTKIVQDTVKDLQCKFTEYLQADCEEGAMRAAEAAVATSKEFADSRPMIWQRYRAVLRRNGRYGEYDLNGLLTIPFVSHIARNWCRLFHLDLFRAFETTTIKAVEELVDEVVQSAPEYLTSRARKQADVSLERTRAFLGESVTTVERALDKEQKSLSRKLEPLVREQLTEGYQAALLIMGRGTTRQQKEAVHEYIDEKKDEVFREAADILMGGLDGAAKLIGSALRDDLTRLSTTVEDTIAVLWEGPVADRKGIKDRLKLIRLLDEAIVQSDVWIKKYSHPVPAAPVS